MLSKASFMLDETTFTAFIKRIRSGTTRRQPELVKRYEPEIHREVRLRLRPAFARDFDSMDICQSVLASFSCVRRWGEYEVDRPERLPRLLVTMARNKLIYQVRRQRRQTRQPPRGRGRTGKSCNPWRPEMSQRRGRPARDSARSASGSTTTSARSPHLRPGPRMGQVASQMGGTPEGRQAAPAPSNASLRKLGLRRYVMSEGKRPPDAPAVSPDDARRAFQRSVAERAKARDVRFLRDAAKLPHPESSRFSVDQWERWQAGDRSRRRNTSKFPTSSVPTPPSTSSMANSSSARTWGNLHRPGIPETLPAICRADSSAVRAASCSESGLSAAAPSVANGPAPRDANRSNTPDSVVSRKQPDTGRPPVGDMRRPNIPGYEIFGEVGRGGMGVVWKARHHRLNRVCALKVIHKDRLSQNPEAAKRFQREAQAAAQLHHTNVVIVYDFDHVGDTYFIAMEYVEGIDLHQLIKDGGPLSIERACDYVRQAALGLQHAFERGLVHRDIKPSNLLVTMPKKGISGFHLLPVLPDKQGMPPPPAPELPTPRAAPPTTGTRPTRPWVCPTWAMNQVGVVKILDMGRPDHAHAGKLELAVDARRHVDGDAGLHARAAMNSHAVDIPRRPLQSWLYPVLSADGRRPFGEYPLIKKLMMHQAADATPVERASPGGAGGSPPSSRSCWRQRKIASRRRTNGAGPGGMESEGCLARPRPGRPRQGRAADHAQCPVPSLHRRSSSRAGAKWNCPQAYWGAEDRHPGRPSRLGHVRGFSPDRATLLRRRRWRPALWDLADRGPATAPCRMLMPVTSTHLSSRPTMPRLRPAPERSTASCGSGTAAAKNRSSSRPFIRRKPPSRPWRSRRTTA